MRVIDSELLPSTFLLDWHMSIKIYVINMIMPI